MNKTIKVALCISLVGIGAFVWVNLATAGRTPKTPKVVTFLSGDIQAEPFTTPGDYVATVDFAKFIPYICAGSAAGGLEGATALLNNLAGKNPITYSAFSIASGGKEPYMLQMKAVVDGVTYFVAMGQFYADSTKTSTPTLDTYDLNKGGLAISDWKGKALLIACGTCGGGVDGPANTKFTMTK
jgi:hypothetical protein